MDTDTVWMQTFHMLALFPVTRSQAQELKHTKIWEDVRWLLPWYHMWNALARGWETGEQCEQYYRHWRFTASGHSENASAFPLLWDPVISQSVQEAKPERAVYRWCRWPVSSVDGIVCCGWAGHNREMERSRNSLSGFSESHCGSASWEIGFFLPQTKMKEKKKNHRPENGPEAEYAPTILFS